MHRHIGQVLYGYFRVLLLLALGQFEKAKASLLENLGLERALGDLTAEAHTLPALGISRSCAATSPIPSPSTGGH